MNINNDKLINVVCGVASGYNIQLPELVKGIKQEITVPENILDQATEYTSGYPKTKDAK